MPWIKTTKEQHATGHLAKLYRDAKGRAGAIANIVRVMSPEPHTLDASMRLYMATTTHPKSPLPRWFRELVAVTVSRLNQCHY